MIHLYAICEGPLALAETVGVGGAPLELRDLDGLTLVISRHERAVAADEAAIVQHADAVDAVAATGATVLPARFERSYPDEDAVANAVQERIAGVRSALENVAGCVELGVRAVDAGPEPPTDVPNDPAAYMRARLARTRRLEQLADAVHEPLASAARDSVRRVVTTGRLELTGAYLVPAASVGAFRAEFDAVAAAHPELSLVCTGPWPPYSFANVGGERT